MLGLFGVAFVSSITYSATAPWAALLPLGLALALIAGWIAAAALAGSPAALMIYFAIVAFVTDAQFRVRAAGDIDADWQSALKFALWLGAGVIGAPYVPPLRILLARPGAALWLAYIVVALISSIYSPVPGYSFGCGLALLCLFAFSFNLTANLSESQILWTIAVTLTVFNIAGWIVFFAYPELGTSAFWTYGGMYLRMCGLAGQANNLGAVCTKHVGAVFLLWYSGRCRSLLALILGGFAFATLITSDSRTGEIAVIAGIIAVYLSRSPVALAASLLAALVGIVLVQLMPSGLDALGSHFSRSGDPTEVYTLTGRLEIWDFTWHRILDSPVVGWGYNSGKVILGGYYGFTNGLMVDSAHNLYLQSLLSTGLVGTLPLFGLLIFMAWTFVSRPVPIVTYFFTVILISSVSDTDAVGTTPTLMTIVFLLISIWPAAPAQFSRR